MSRGLTGEYRKISTVGDEVCQAFMPHSLPPKPPLVFNATLQDLYEKALLGIGGLANLSSLLDTSIFIYHYIRKEALLSSQIEGAQSSFDDLLLHESSATAGVPFEEVEEVSNYIRAMNHGMKRIRDEGFPLSLRLIKEIHSELLARGRGAEKAPGEFRNSQNWIGGDRETPFSCRRLRNAYSN